MRHALNLVRSGLRMSRRTRVHTRLWPREKGGPLLWKSDNLIVVDMSNLLLIKKLLQFIYTSFLVDLLHCPLQYVTFFFFIKRNGAIEIYNLHIITETAYSCMGILHTS